MWSIYAPLLAIAAGHSSQLSPNFQTDAHVHAARLRRELLSDYDATVPPVSVRSSAGTASQTGTDVDMQLRIFKVSEVNIAGGVMKLKIWLQLATAVHGQLLCRLAH